MDIKGYIVTVICVCVSSSLISILAPEGDGGIGRQVRLAAGIVTALAVIAPIVGIIEGVGEMDISGLISDCDEKTDEYQSIFDEQMSDLEEENVKDGIKSILAKQFNVEPADCSVSLTFEEIDGNRRIRRVLITLYGSAVWSDSGAIEDHFRDILGCEVITAVGK